jgi:hypothetical protein
MPPQWRCLWTLSVEPELGDGRSRPDQAILADANPIRSIPDEITAGATTLPRASGFRFAFSDMVASPRRSGGPSGHQVSAFRERRAPVLEHPPWRTKRPRSHRQHPFSRATNKPPDDSASAGRHATTVRGTARHEVCESGNNFGIFSESGSRLASRPRTRPAPSTEARRGSDMPHVAVDLGQRAEGAGCRWSPPIRRERCSTVVGTLADQLAPRGTPESLTAGCRRSFDVIQLEEVPAENRPRA